MDLPSASVWFAIAFVGVIVLAAAWKYWELRIADAWPSVVGKIVASQSTSRPVKKPDGLGLETRNFAEIIYEFEVNGSVRRASSIGPGRDPSEDEIEEMLARYPEGAGVIVFHDPADPSRSRLERDASAGSLRVLVLFVLAGFGFLAGLIWGPDRVIDVVRAFIPAKENSSLAAIFAFLGVVVSVAALALMRDVKATQNWRSTWGRMENESRRQDGLSVLVPQVHYSYRAGGKHYEGERLFFGLASSLIARLVSWKRMSNYPKGYPVEVFYDPDNPRNAVLQRHAAGIGWLWVLAAVFFAAAVRTAGYV